VVEARRQRRIAAGWLDWIGCQNLAQTAATELPSNGGTPVRHLVQNDAQGEQVGAVLCRLAHDRLGSQIGGSAHNPPEPETWVAKARIPKSLSFTSPSSVIMMLAGLTSP